MKRRTLLKSLAAFGVGTLVYNPILGAFAASNTKLKGIDDIGTWYPSTCQGCTTWCPIQVLVQNGRAVKVRGNSNSKINPGTVCPRGHLIPQQMYDPDRLKMPLKRTNPQKGKGIDPQFVPITWDEAMTTIATQLMALRNSDETDKLLYLRGRYTFSTDIQYTSFLKIFGTPNKFSHSTICAEAEKCGPYYTEAYWGYRDYDLDNCKYLLLWGVDPFRSNRMVPNAIHKYEAIRKNAIVTVIDPVLNSSAAKAHNWVPVIPGEDGALACAIAHQVLVNGGWHKIFVGDFNDGINKFIAGTPVIETDFTEIKTKGIVKWWNIELKDKTPLWAESITGIPSATIIQIAVEMAAAAPNVSVWLGPGPVMAPRGLYTAMAIHALNGLMGSVQNVGGPCRQPSVPSAGVPSETSFQDARALAGLARKKIGASGSLSLPGMAPGALYTDKSYGKAAITNDIPNALLANPNAIKACIGYWCNFPFSCTDPSRWYNALSALPFFVHITTNASEMSQFADILLPAAFPTTENWSYLKTSGNRYSEASIQQPMATRLFDVKGDENEISYLLAQKLAVLGFTNLLDYYKTFTDPTTGSVPTNEQEFAEYSTKKFLKPCYDTLGGGWTEFKEKGVVSYNPHAYQKNWNDFGTASKKFEFYSETLKLKLQEFATYKVKTIDEVLAATNYLATGEVAFVPHYEPPLRHGDIATYPLSFIDVKSRFNREGRSANLPSYYQFKKLDPGDENWSDVVKINPVDAATYGITDGALVKITSLAGVITCKAKLWQGVRPGTVAKSFGQGHWAYGRFASNYANAIPNGGNNNEILVEDYERISGSTARNGGFVGVSISLA